jgi:hypothetical protein
MDWCVYTCKYVVVDRAMLRVCAQLHMPEKKVSVTDNFIYAYTLDLSLDQIKICKHKIETLSITPIQGTIRRELLLCGVLKSSRHAHMYVTLSALSAQHNVLQYGTSIMSSLNLRPEGHTYDESNDIRHV